MRLLICGGRNYNDKVAVNMLLNQIHALYPVTFVIHGGAKGADQLGENWALDHNIPCKCYLPNWNKYGRGAGPRRNEQMLIQGKPELCVAFPGGPGTRDMVARCTRALVPVIRNMEEILIGLELMQKHLIAAARHE